MGSVGWSVRGLSIAYRNSRELGNQELALTPHVNVPIHVQS